MPLPYICSLSLLGTLSTFFAFSGTLCQMGSSTSLETLSCGTVFLQIELPITLVFMLQQIFIQSFDKFLYLTFFSAKSFQMNKLIINETKFKQYSHTKVIEMKEPYINKVYKQGLLPLYICDVTTYYHGWSSRQNFKAVHDPWVPRISESLSQSHKYHLIHLYFKYLLDTFYIRNCTVVPY